MTISTEVRKAGPYIGNGAAATYPFAFKVFKAEDLVVVRRQTEIGVDTILVLTSDYTVSLNADQDASPGGSITLVAGPLPSGYLLVISSDLPFLQPTDLTNQGGFYPKVITNALDRLTIFCQQLMEGLGRSLTLPITAPDGVSTELPFPTASNVIGWDEDAIRLRNFSPQELATIAAYGDTLADQFTGDGTTTAFTLTKSPGGINNLDVSVGGVTQRPIYDYVWDFGTHITFTTAPAAPGVPGAKNILVRYAQALPQNDNALREELAAVDGTSKVGGALYADIRTYFGSATRMYCLGRSNMFDGAHGWFKRTGAQADNDGVYLVDALGRTWVRELNEEVNPVWWGALPLGGGDSLPALTAASTFARTRGGFVPPIIRVPGGNYTVNGMWDVFDLAQATVIMDGPYFSGVGAAALDAVIRVNNASNLKITGSCTVSANYLSNYASAFAVVATPGGVILPTPGIVSHMDVFGMTVRDSLIGFKIGKKDVDAQVAELQFHGCETMFCPIAVYNGGSQTGATYNGCTLASGVGTFSLASKFRVLEMDGGLVQIIGGEFINSGVPNTAANHVAVDFKPAESTLYGNPFGTLKLSGVHVELTSGFADIGPGAIAAARKSNIANISVSNCAGYIDQIAAGNYVNIYDTTYGGKVAFDDTCNFYAAAARTGQNINSAAAGAILSVGRLAFGDNFKDWMGGAIGGILKHPLLPVAVATTTAQSFAASTATIVKLTTISGSSGMNRYSVYSSSTGEVTVPSGCRNLTIKMTAQGSGFTGDIFVRKNGAGTAQFGAVGSGGVVCLDFNEVAPVAGDKYTIIMQPSTGPITLNGAKMTVYMEF